MLFPYEKVVYSFMLEYEGEQKLVFSLSFRRLTPDLINFCQNIAKYFSPKGSQIQAIFMKILSYNKAIRLPFCLVKFVPIFKKLYFLTTYNKEIKIKCM